MKTYVISTAIDAIEALGLDASLDERLELAWGKLGLVNSYFYVEDSVEIRRAFKSASEAFSQNDLQRKSQTIQSLIKSIFNEEGSIQNKSF